MPAQRRLDRRMAAVHLAMLVAAAALLILFVQLGPAVVGGGFGLKALFLGRTAALLLLATWLLHREGRRWRDVGLGRAPWLRSVVVVLLGLVTTGVVVALVKAELVRLGFRPADYSAFASLRGNLPEYIFWIGPVTIGSAAFGEEMLFRGFMLDHAEWLLGGPGRWTTPAAIVLQAMLFGLLHAYQGVGGVATTAVMGVVLGAIWRIAGRNLWPGIFIHAILDGSAMTAIFLGASVV